MQLDGIHHVTAITGDAPRNVDFYARVLGLRLVAKTVNQDDPSVYHLFYGSESAEPGADLTFFEYPRAVPGRAGAGSVHRIVHRVGSSEALGFWADRLAAESVSFTHTTSLRFADPEGLEHELVVTDAPDEPVRAEHPEVPTEYALQGFEGVRAYSAAPTRSARLLETVLGARRIDDPDAPDGRFELRGQHRGAWIALDRAPAAPGRQSAGTVHHVAWHTWDADLATWIERVSAAGLPNSGFVDRHFFHSLYVREPGGILFEMATAEPGFTADTPVAQLGRTLVLPPFLEANRARIEARLTPLPDPRTVRPVRP